MGIHSIQQIASPFAKELTEVTKSHEETGDKSFSHFLNDSIGNVNQMLHTADKKNMEVAVGKSENLHDAMISFEKAETALKLLVQVRNKALEAYHEVMRMQA